MKIILFVPTGETRCPKTLEWYANDRDEMKQADTVYQKEWPILTLHEIEIPEGSHTLTLQAKGSRQTPPSIHIPLPRPKVKKWKFVVMGNVGMFITGRSYTISEVVEEYPGNKWYHKIDQTEVYE
jgi:hypothetical protein